MSEFKKSRVYYAGIQKGLQTKCGNFFLIVLCVFFAVFLGYLICAHRTLEQSQERIKDSYAIHVAKADSMYMHLLGYNKDVVISKQKATDAILADSLIKSILSNTQHLSTPQSKKIQFTIENYFRQTEQLHNKYEEKLLRDSLRLCTERELLEGQIKTMIDLHLNKVEHEYSNITIWAAALTILFLVFSFYSIYKMDELIQQGNEGLKDIRRIKGEGEKTKDQLRTDGKALIEETKTSIDQLNTDGKALLEETKTSINTFVEAQQKRIQQTFGMSKNIANEMTALYDGMRGDLGTIKEEFDRRAFDAIGVFEMQLQDLLRKESAKFNSNKQKFDVLFTKVNALFKQLKEYGDNVNNSKQNGEREEGEIC